MEIYSIIFLLILISLYKHEFFQDPTLPLPAYICKLFGDFFSIYLWNLGYGWPIILFWFNKFRKILHRWSEKTRKDEACFKEGDFCTFFSKKIFLSNSQKYPSSIGVFFMKNRSCVKTFEKSIKTVKFESFLISNVI